MADTRAAPPAAGVRQELRAARILLRAALRAALQYRASFVSAIVGGIVFQGTQLLFIGVLLARFGSLAGWSFAEVGLLFSVRLAAHACYVVPFGNLFQIDRIVRDGEVDRMLIRPAHVWSQVVFGRFPLMAVGDAILGLGAVAVFAVRAPVDWSPATVAYLVAAVVGGGLVETGVQTFLAGCTFRIGNTQSMRVLADDTLVRFSGYPLTMFGRWGLWSLSFVFPMAFIAFLPTSVLLGRVDAVALPTWLVYASPAAGPVVLVLSLLFFHRMVRHYASPGN